MNISQLTRTFVWLAALAITVHSCKSDKDCEDPVQPAGASSYSIHFHLEHFVGTDPLVFNQLIYQNPMGQDYKVEKLRYLISNMTLHGTAGTDVQINGYHFVDFADPTTWEYDPGISIPEQDFSGISFTFGFDEQDNISGAYTDLNSVNWGWPMMLGGGYHAMQLEGKFVDTNGTEAVFATHKGNIAREITPTDTIFHTNYFNATLANSGFSLNGNKHVHIKMDLNNWYQTPNMWDFNVYNAPIMPIYEAQIWLNENGQDVFSLEDID